MEEQDKIYLWLVVIAFAALLIGALFAVMEKTDLSSPENVTATTSR
jgi:hypothetical protein